MLEVDAFFSHIDEDTFTELLQIGDVDAAWTWLPDIAELCLCFQIQHPMRSEHWEPCTIRKKRFQGCVSGSRRYKALLKLQARLQVLAHRPWDEALHRRLLSLCATLESSARSCPVWVCVRPRPLRLSRSCCKIFGVEQQALRGQWRLCMRNDPSRVRSFVKCKADAQLDREQRLPPAQESCCYKSAVEAVDQQATSWMAKWSPDAAASALRWSIRFLFRFLGRIATTHPSAFLARRCERRWPRCDIKQHPRALV